VGVHGQTVSLINTDHLLTAALLKESPFKMRSHAKGIDKLVREATSNKKWGPNSDQLRELANLSFTYDGFICIMKVLWKRVNDNGKYWRHIYKSLAVMHHLICSGNESVKADCRSRIVEIKTLGEFQYLEHGQDVGISVREKARMVMEVLRNPVASKKQTQKAKSIKVKVVGKGSNKRQQASNSTPQISGNKSKNESKNEENVDDDSSASDSDSNGTQHNGVKESTTRTIEDNSVAEVHRPRTNTRGVVIDSSNNNTGNSQQNSLFQPFPPQQIFQTTPPLLTPQQEFQSNTQLYNSAPQPHRYLNTQAVISPSAAQLQEMMYNQYYNHSLAQQQQFFQHQQAEKQRLLQQQQAVQQQLEQQYQTSQFKKSSVNVGADPWSHSNLIDLQSLSQGESQNMTSLNNPPSLTPQSSQSTNSTQINNAVWGIYGSAINKQL